MLDMHMSIELCPLLRLAIRCGPLALIVWIGEPQALLAGALSGLNLWVVRGKSLAFEKLCLARTECLAVMISDGFLHRVHVSSFQFRGGVCHPLIV